MNVNKLVDFFQQLFDAMECCLLENFEMCREKDLNTRT